MSGSFRRWFSPLVAAWCLAVSLPLPVVAAEADPEVNEFYEDAQERFNQAEYDAAIIQLKNALQKAPEHLPSLVLLGQCYLETGDGPAAESTLNEARERGADLALTAAPRARALLLQFRHRELLAEALPPGLPPKRLAELLEVKADAALQLNDRKALKQILKDIQNLHVNSPGELAIRATLAMREGRLDDAERLVNTALAATPDSPLTRLTRASLSHVKDAHEEAMKEYAEVITLEPGNVPARLARIGLLFDLNRPAESTDDFAFFDKRESKDPRFLYMKALNAQRNGDPKQARAVLDELSKLLETLGTRIVRSNLQLLMIAGMANYHIGNYELAESYLEQYVKASRGETLTRRMLATLQIRKKDYTSAIKLLTATLEAEGESPEILSLLASAYSADGQHQRATAALERATTLRPDDTRLQTSLAMSRALKGQSEAALASLSEVFDSDAKGEAAGMPLAVLRLTRNDYAGAEEVASRLLDAEPGNLTYLNLHGVTLVGLDRPQEARVRFEKALSLNANYRPALLNIAKLDRREGRLDEAAARLEGLRKAKPDDGQVLLELARVSAARGNTKAALKSMRAAYKAQSDSLEIAGALTALLLEGKDVEGARNVILEQETKHPNNLEVLDMKTRLLLASGKHDDLRAHLKRMAETAEFNVDWLTRIGESQIRYGYLADAQYALFKALQEKPRDVPLRARVGDIEVALGKLDEAERRARKLVDDFPDHPAGHALLGDVATARQRFADGAEHYAEARRRPDGDRPEIALKQFEALRDAGQVDAAEAVLEDWQSRHPTQTWAALRRAELAMNQGELPAARAGYEAVLEQDAHNAEALNNLANVLLRSGDLAAAEARARAALEVAPENPYVLDTLGWVLTRAERAKEALPYLREARTRAANLPEIRYHLAATLEKLGRRAEALKELEPAVATGVDFGERAEALRLRDALGDES
ncbi:MAG: XrtA/PEP-CTERM system TPR-repeat protein PrsT [Gammaproteobacteria bacterium]